MTEFVVSNDIDEIKALVKEDFVPVECSIGGQSIINDLMMDHHGEYSHLDGVAVRAYSDYFGVCKNAPGFVVAGNADADATFAVAALLGIIPHPDYVVSKIKNPAVIKAMTRDLTNLAETINEIDTNGLLDDMFSLPDIGIVMTWNAMSTGRDNLSFATGVGLWRNLLTGNPAQLEPFFKAPVEAEKNRHDLAMEDYKNRGVQISPEILIIKGSRVFGFPEWYEHNPIVLAWTENNENVTIGCRNIDEAERLLGKGGLKNIFPELQPYGWGGRETVGGSPRGVTLTWEEVLNAANTIKEDIELR